MLCLSKKTEYALIALGYLAERNDRVISAREVASAFDLPLPLLMNILKTLNRHGLLDSVRGVRGGYRIRNGLADASLHDLITILDGDAPEGDLIEVHQDPSGIEHRPLSENASVQLLNARLERFLDELKLADLILPVKLIETKLFAVAI